MSDPMVAAKRKIIISLFIGGVLAVFGFVFFYIQILVPAKVLKNPDWWQETPPEQQVIMAHKILKYPVGNHHDAFLILLEFGSAQSIPYLLSGLKWHDFFNRDSDFVLCAKDHCLEALRKITQKDLGSAYSDWKILEDNNPKDNKSGG